MRGKVEVDKTAIWAFENGFSDFYVSGKFLLFYGTFMVRTEPSVHCGAFEIVNAYF